ncbi:MAG: hypothetical protein ACJ71Z_08610 [Aeromicrobium sp.]
MTLGDSTSAMGNLDQRLERLGAWSGLAWVLFAGSGFVGAGLVPVQNANTDAGALAGYLNEFRIQILIGMLVLLIGGYTFLITWSLTLAQQIRKYANPSSMAFHLLVNIGLANAIIGMLVGLFGSAMAFRVQTMAADTTQLLYDLLWWLFLLPWAPTMLWQAVAGFAILSKHNEGVMFPRWLGYFSLWGAALEPFSALSVFYYFGPFSYNGLVVLWVPGVSFFVWVLTFSIVQVRAWKRVQSAQFSNEAESGSISMGAITVPPFGRG